MTDNFDFDDIDFLTVNFNNSSETERQGEFLT